MSDESDVAGYRVYVEPCSEQFNCVVLQTGQENTDYRFPSDICDGVNYSFFVQSTNDCGGGGPNSSMVTLTCGECVRAYVCEVKPGSQYDTRAYVASVASGNARLEQCFVVFQRSVSILTLASYYAQV